MKQVHSPSSEKGMPNEGHLHFPIQNSLETDKARPFPLPIRPGTTERVILNAA